MIRPKRRPRRLLDAAEAMALLGISPEWLDSLMRHGQLGDRVMYGDKPWFRAIDVRQVSLRLGRKR